MGAPLPKGIVGRYRGQSALEYLITYGWALLLVAIVASFLYLYVIAPSAIVPSQCSFASGMQCNDLVLGMNSTTRASELAIYATNAQPYPIENPMLYVNINGANTTAVPCKPNYVLAGGSMICEVPLSQKVSFNQLVAGNLYINALYCGLTGATTPTSCSASPSEVYSGKFNAHVQPLVSTNSTITLSAVNTTNPGNPANNAKDQLMAAVKLLGYPLTGATVNFTARFQNNTNAVPPYSFSSQYATTGPNGVASDYVWGTTVGKVIVEATYAGISASVTINFTNIADITFSAPSAAKFMSNSPATLATVDGKNYDYGQLTTTQFLWGCGSSHTYSFSQMPYNSSGTRLLFQNTKINGIASSSASGTIVVNCALTNQTESAAYSPQYALTMAASPPSSGTVSPAPGTYWYYPGAQVTLNEQPSPGHTFNGWTGSGTGSYSGTTASPTITMYAPITETANYYIPTVTVKFASSSMSGATGTVVNVDGTNIAYSRLPYSITVPYGSTVTYSYGSPVAGSPGTRYAYSSLSGCGQSAQSGSFSATSPCTVTASYSTQYYLTMAVSPPGTGSISPGSGWYNAGSGVTISESPAPNYAFNYWTCSGTGCYSGTATSATITMSAPITETANYYTVTTTSTSTSTSITTTIIPPPPPPTTTSTSTSTVTTIYYAGACNTYFFCMVGSCASADIQCPSSCPQPVCTQGYDGCSSSEFGYECVSISPPPTITTTSTSTSTTTSTSTSTITSTTTSTVTSTSTSTVSTSTTTSIRYASCGSCLLSGESCPSNCPPVGDSRCSQRGVKCGSSTVSTTSTTTSTTVSTTSSTTSTIPACNANCDLCLAQSAPIGCSYYCAGPCTTNGFFGYYNTICKLSCTTP